MEEELLLGYLLALEGKLELGCAVGENARDYIRRVHEPERLVDL